MKRNRDNRLVQDFRRLPPKIRVINSLLDEGEQSRTQVMTPREAYDLVEQTGLDLFCVSDNTDIPVFRLDDFGKFLYAEQKRQRENDRKNRENARPLKEMQFNLNIAQHDFLIKLDHIRDWLKENHDVRISVRGNRTNRMSLPRGVAFADIVKRPEFILHRVLEALEGVVHPARLTVSDNSINATLRGL